ncbi:hypothetical protein GQ53DRAFT_740899 [Thozetella sp. PMI_491]|nr:hypothetical protein GQ53DRAFT_740899 [Thozetella sp. PMI_491]
MTKAIASPAAVAHPLGIVDAVAALNRVLAPRPLVAIRTGPTYIDPALPAALREASLANVKAAISRSSIYSPKDAENWDGQRGTWGTHEQEGD